MNKLDINITKLKTAGDPKTSTSGTSTSGDFDPARVFADPVRYLEKLGIRSELIEASPQGLRTAA